MELQQLRYAVALAETRSFTRAAERYRVVQSALSHQIKALETELGVALFARTSRRVEITDAGERLLVHAREALAAVDRAQADAMARTGELTGRVTLGLIPTVTAFDVPAVIGEFHRSHPRVQVVVRSGASEEFIADLSAGALDVAVLGLAEEPAPVPRVAIREVLRSTHVAVVGAGHRLAGRRRLRLDDLTGEDFADFPENSGGRRQSDLAFERAGLRRTVAFETISAELICGLVEQDLAVALLPAEFLIDRVGVISIPVLQGPHRVEYLAWNTFNPTAPAAALVAHLAPSPH